MPVTILLVLVACGLLIATVSQISFAGLRTARASAYDHAYRRRMQVLHRRTAQIARLESEIVTPANSKGAVPWRILEVREVVQESADCKSFYLVDPHRQELPNYFPGQYLMVRPALASGKQVTRCYSLSDTPQSDCYRITVKRQQPSETAVPGSGGLSAYLHDKINPGDCLLIGGPAGQFYLAPDMDTPLVLLAAGIGITPVVAMLRWSLKHTPNRPILVLFQAKDAIHWPFGRQLHDWQLSCRNLRVVTYFSGKEQPSSIGNGAMVRIGKFAAKDIVRYLKDPKQSNYYMCGPDSWMTSMRDGLAVYSVPTSQIHWESFGGTATKKPDATAKTITDSSAEEFLVNFSLSQRQATWSDPEQSLWELARSNDIEIPSGCLSGACGSCKLRLLNGTVKNSTQATAELAEGECLPCVARPSSDLIIEA